MTLADILKDSNYKLTQFSPEQISRLQESIIEKDNKGKPVLNGTVFAKELKEMPDHSNKFTR